MHDDEQRLLEEVDFWLRFNNDYLLRHGRPPTRRMQEALFHALDRLRTLSGSQRDATCPAGDPVSETLN